MIPMRFREICHDVLRNGVDPDLLCDELIKRWKF